MEYVKVVEGKAQLLVPNPSLFRRSDGVYEPSWAPVFYNPRATLNRDLSVTTLAKIAEYYGVNSFNIADVLAGVGVRGIRYFLEVQSTNNVVINDINQKAVQLIRENLNINGIKDRVSVYRCDANALLYKLREDKFKLNYVDIDPYGTPIPFIGSALSTISRGGFLGITATDIATLSGVKHLAGSRRYGANLFRTDFKYEVGLRVLLGYIARRAAEIDKYLEPIIGVFHDYYLRIFVRVDKGASKSQKMLSENIGYILYCKNCLQRQHVNDLDLVNTTCSKCGSKLNILGPLWVGIMNNKEFITQLTDLIKTKYNYLNSLPRLLKLIMMIRDEVEVPYYYDVTAIASVLRVNMPKIHEVIECLENNGFKASRTHLTPTGVKTSAHFEIVKKCVSN
ncbi:MAG: tRNA (guanine(10)-N(2))-dimethyltransferase [Sulfolobales archaeon]